VDAVLQSTMRKALRRHAGDAEKTSFLAAALGSLHGEKHPDRNLGSFRTSTFASSPLRRYPRLREAVVAAAADALHRLRRDAHAMTSAMVDMEAAYFDAEFFRKARAERARDGDDDSTRTAKFPSSSPNADPSDYSDSSSRLKTIASSVRLYVEAVRDRLAKTVPKAIVFRQVAVARRGVLATPSCAPGWRRTPRSRGGALCAASGSSCWTRREKRFRWRWGSVSFTGSALRLFG
jgi:dynamin 1-like protein